MSEQEQHLKVANASGFPFQIAIENLVKTTNESHGWKVRHIEHAWLDRTNKKPEFIDLVLKNRFETCTMVVECKRVRNGSWLFMSSNGSTQPRRHCKTWVATIGGNGETRHYGWQDLSIDPSTPEALFCMNHGQGDSKSTLERIASGLVASTESLAIEENSIFSPYNGIQLYFSVIVTTAQLKVCNYSPTLISLADGELKDAEFVAVPYLRFRKALLAKDDDVLRLLHESPGMDGGESVHTVFVVNSEHFAGFLSEFDIEGANIRGFV